MHQRRTFIRARRTEGLYFWIFISPWIVGFLLLWAGPLVYSLVLSLHHWNIGQEPVFIGFQNYQRAFEEPVFWHSLKITAIYTFFAVPASLALSLFVAVLMNQKIPAIGFFRTVYYLPQVLSGVAVSLMWWTIFDQDWGIVNGVISRVFGVAGPGWLTDPKWVLVTYVIIGLWGFGRAMVIFLAALQNVPKELLEAAEVDGAGPFRRFVRITLPIISPAIFLNLVMNMISSMQIFQQAYVITQGGPANASLFYVLYLYREAWNYFHMGYASALAWILFVVILGLTLLVFRSSALWVYYEQEVR